LVQGGLLQGLVPPPPGRDLFYVVVARCPGCNARAADFLIANSKEPSDYKEKVARYQAATTLTAEMLTTFGGDVRIEKNRPF
jgi:hypothetical protein